MKKSIFSVVLLIGAMTFLTFFLQGTSDRKSTSEALISPYDIPGNIEYCGEKVPIEDEEVKERLERELLGNAFWESSNILHLKKTGRYFPVIETILKKYNLPSDLKYISVAESGLTNVVSPAGAAGYWQFIPGTGRLYGLEINDEVDERYHIEKATDAACRYLRDMHDILGNWTLATASYNCGIGGVQQNISFQKVDNYYDLYLNSETSRYVFRIIALKEILSNPVKYKYNMGDEDFYKPFETVKIKVEEAIPNLADWAITHGINYKILKNLNPWLRKSSLTNKAGKIYYIEIPSGKINFRPSDKFAEELQKQEADTNSRLHKLENIENAMQVYKVLKGETLASIAKKLKVSEESLKQWNGLKNTGVKPGQMLKYQKPADEN